MRAGVIVAVLFASLASLGAAHAQSTGTAVCPYSAAELKHLFGLELNEGEKLPEPKVPLGRQVECRYGNKDLVKPSLWIAQLIADTSSEAVVREQMKSMARLMDPLPNDPDQAFWQARPGDASGAALMYFRKGIRVDVRLTVGSTNKAFAEAMRAKLLKLRRVP